MEKYVIKFLVEVTIKPDGLLLIHSLDKYELLPALLETLVEYLDLMLKQLIGEGQMMENLQLPMFL